jgi:hypothetical protein
MRYLTYTLGLAAVLFAAGCTDSKWAFLRSNRDDSRSFGDSPKAPDLVRYLNQNAQQIQSLECPSLDLDIEQGSGLAAEQFGALGKMVCEKPRNFRLVADVAGKYGADIGSNKDEFWYWTAQDKTFLVHCSYADLERGVRIPFPFQPEWVMQALGMATYDPAQNYHVTSRGRTLELVSDTVSQGQRVQRVTVFNKANSQVREHLLRDAQGKEICSAQILESQNLGGVTVPRIIVFSYPAEKLKLKIKLNSRSQDIILNRQMDPSRATVLFTRPNLSGVRAYDLARGPDDGNPISPAGGVLPSR